MKSPRVGALAPLPLLLALTSAGATASSSSSSAVPITVEIVDDAASCTAMKLTGSNTAVRCSGGSGSTDCHAGDTAAIITGDLLVHNTINDNPTVVLTPCVSIMGVVMTSMCSDPIEAGYLCDWYNYDYNGGECGAIGSGFAISHNMTIPREVEQIDEWREKTFGYLPGVGVHVAVSFTDEYCGYQQEQQEEALTANEGAMNMAYVGAGVVFAMGALSLLDQLFDRSGRNRRIATDEDENGQNFVEMKDTYSIAVV